MEYRKNVLEKTFFEKSPGKIVKSIHQEIPCCAENLVGNRDFEILYRDLRMPGNLPHPILNSG